MGAIIKKVGLAKTFIREKTTSNFKCAYVEKGREDRRNFAKQCFQA